MLCLPWPVNPIQGGLVSVSEPRDLLGTVLPWELQEGLTAGRGIPFPRFFPLCLPRSFLRQLDPSLPPRALSQDPACVLGAAWLLALPVWDGCLGMGLPGSPPSISSKGLGWDFPSWKEELLPQGFWKGISYF